MGWDAEQAEDAYWEARASGLTDDEIMAMDEPDWEDQGSTPPWLEDPADWPDDDRRRDEPPGDPDEDIQTGGYPDWNPTGDAVLEILMRMAGNPLTLERTINPKSPKEGQNMPYETYSEEPRYLGGLRQYNAAHGRVPDAKPQTKAELEAMLAWAATQLVELEREPEEPELSTDEGPLVVTWDITRSGARYSYAALRVASGRKEGQWAITGPTSPSYLTWEGLLAWIKKTNDSGKLPEIRYVDSWETV